jgi:hypothetical protein
MTWTRPFGTLVEVIVVLWLFQITFKPRKSNEAQCIAKITRTTKSKRNAWPGMGA